jgi:hypothetical protein
LKKSDHLKYLGVDGSITLECIFKEWDRDMDWTELARDKKRWWVLMNAVNNLLVI